MYKKIVSPSILSADFGNLARDIINVAEAGAEYIHIDVMDGSFVPSISYGMPVIKSVRPVTDKTFDVHLMIVEPIRYIDDFVKAGADLITVHIEACKDVKATLEAIKERNLKVGLTLNPATPVSDLAPYLHMVDMVLIMSVNPGFGGQKFIPDSIGKIKELVEMREKAGLHFDIEVDGGITFENVKEVYEAGANVIVAGSTVYKGDAGANVKRLLELME